MRESKNDKDGHVGSSSLGQPRRRCRRLFVGLKGGYSYKKQLGSLRTESGAIDQAIAAVDTFQDYAIYLDERSCIYVRLRKWLHGICIVYRGIFLVENDAQSKGNMESFDMALVALHNSTNQPSRCIHSTYIGASIAGLGVFDISGLERWIRHGYSVNQSGASTCLFFLFLFLQSLPRNYGNYPEALLKNAATFLLPAIAASVFPPISARLVLLMRKSRCVSKALFFLFPPALVFGSGLDSVSLVFDLCWAAVVVLLACSCTSL